MTNKIGSFFLELIQVVVFAVSIFLFVYLLVMQPHKIKGSSMEPNFHDGEYLLTDKVTYRFGEVSRGDVVVFKAPPTFQDEFIKRVIGLPGDQVWVENGKVFVNGQELSEPYLKAGVFTASGKTAPEGVHMTIPENQYFVLGDNREHSLDSRNIGFIEKDTITGRGWFVYWPISSAGTISKPTYTID